MPARAKSAVGVLLLQQTGLELLPSLLLLLRLRLGVLLLLLVLLLGLLRVSGKQHRL